MESGGRAFFRFRFGGEVSSRVSPGKSGLGWSKKVVSRLRGRWIFFLVEQSMNLTCLRMGPFPTNFSVFVVIRKF